MTQQLFPLSGIVPTSFNGQPVSLTQAPAQVSQPPAPATPQAAVPGAAPPTAQQHLTGITEPAQTTASQVPSTIQAGAVGPSQAPVSQYPYGSGYNPNLLGENSIYGQQ